MKKTELEYAEQLIEQYSIRMGSRGYQNFKSVCVQPKPLPPNTDFLDIVINDEKNPF